VKPGRKTRWDEEKTTNIDVDNSSQCENIQPTQWLVSASGLIGVQLVMMMFVAKREQ